MRRAAIFVIRNVFLGILYKVTPQRSLKKYEYEEKENQDSE